MSSLKCTNNACPIPDPFLWELLDSENRTVMNGGKHTTESQLFYFYRKCLPVDGCMAFKFLESSYNGSVRVDYYEDGNLVSEIKKDFYNDNNSRVIVGTSTGKNCF